MNLDNSIFEASRIMFEPPPCCCFEPRSYVCKRRWTSKISANTNMFGKQAALKNCTDG